MDTNSTISEPIFQSIFEGLQSAIPEGSLLVSQWAETYRYVSSERSANPGRWSNSLTPWLVEIMDAACDPRVKKIVLMKSSQIAGTEAICNIFGYFIHIDPTLIMYLCENEGKAESWSKEAFMPMCRETPVLRDLIAANKERDSSNTIKLKTFRGGNLVVAWATSPATLSSRPRRVIAGDEVDAFEPTKEGDPLKLAEARTKTFENKLLILVSSPRDKETSVIESEYENSDMRKFYVPCPACDGFQVLKWANVRWEDEPREAFYLCEYCEYVIEEHEKNDMVARGIWEAEAEFRGTAGFWINELYSPFSTWGDMAEDFLECKKIVKEKGDTSRLQVFINTRLGETWENEGEKIEYADLSFNQEEFEAEVPDGVLLLTAGVDVQDDRLECEVVGWGLDFESWSLYYKVFYGDPGDKTVWEELKMFLTREFSDATGRPFSVKAAAVDSGGHHTDEVYKFCKANAGRRFYAVKGWNVYGKPIAPRKPSIQSKIRCKLFMIGTDSAKDKILTQLKTAEPGPNYCHFPEDRDEEYFKMLCAEKKITVFTAGKSKTKWVKIKASARNEALDCRVYALAAVHIINPDWQSFVQRREKLLEISENSGEKDTPNSKKSENVIKRREKRTKPSRPFVRRNSGGGFVKSY